MNLSKVLSFNDINFKFKLIKLDFDIRYYLVYVWLFNVKMIVI